MEQFIVILIRRERLRQNYSQEGLCRGICAVSYLSKIEQGKVQAGTDVVLPLLRRLGVDFETDEAFLSWAGSRVEILYRELLAGREKAEIFRRTLAELEREEERCLRCRELVLHPETREAVLSGRPLELTARVKSQLRRYTQLNPNSGSREQANNEITIKGMVINKDNHKVIVDDEEIKLTPIEFDILYLLASNPGRVFSTDEIFEKVWNEKVYEANNTVMVHIRRLRGKLKEDTRQSKIITTVWGVGYKIEK